MSAPEPTPFAVVRHNGIYWCSVIGDVSRWSTDPNVDDGDECMYWEHGFVEKRAEDHAAEINRFFNAAVQRERQAAAVKAMWDAVYALDAVLGESAKFDPAANWLRGRAEAMQYIASRAERAEKGEG